MLIGIAIGGLIGLVSGSFFVFLLKALVEGRAEDSGRLVTELKIVSEMLAIPTFWFGGPWVVAKMLQDLSWSDHLESYASALAISFVLVTAFPLVMFVKKITSMIGTN